MSPRASISLSVLLAKSVFPCSGLPEMVTSPEGGSFMEVTMICAELVWVENAEDPPEMSVVA